MKQGNWQAALFFVRTVVSRDWRFLSVTMISCIVAATVATFQYSVFNSFRLASAVIPREVSPDFWIKARGVDCFDFPTPISEDYGAILSRYFPEASFRRVVFGFLPWRSPSGRNGNVALVGIEDYGISETGFVANRSDLSRLNLGAQSGGVAEASIADTTLFHEGTVDSLSTYVGAPYLLASFETARRLMRMDPTATAFIAGNFGGAEPENFDSIAVTIARNYPDVSIIRGRDFSKSSSDYWQNKTGAGLAILLAAALASLLMVILLANGVMRFMQRYTQDLLSLLGHGANEGDISKIVTGIAAIISLTTFVGAVVVTPLLVAAFQPLLPWALFSAADLIVPLAGISVAFACALLATRNALARFGPEAVFRS